MDPKLSVKLVSLFLISSICLLGYVVMDANGTPTPSPRYVAIDQNIEFYQSAMTSYYFDTDTYVTKLTLSDQDIDINDAFSLNVAVSSGSVDVTITDWNFTDDGQIEFVTDQYLAKVTLTCTIGDISSMCFYTVSCDGISLGTHLSMGKMVQFSYYSESATHTFIVHTTPYSRTAQNLWAVVFLIVALMATVITMAPIVVQMKRHESPNPKEFVVRVIVIIIILTFLGIMFALVGS
jgi:hypothetical protein